MKSYKLKLVRELIEIAKSQEMYSWLNGLDSTGQVPRDAAYYRLLYLLAETFKFEKMVDLGTAEGVSAMCMARGNPDGRVFTIDRDDKVNPRCRMDNILYCNQDAIDGKTWYEFGIGLLFIDILHTPESMQKAFEMYAPFVIEDGVIILDGVNWNGASEDMPAWWNGFNPFGYTKITDIGLHALEDAGVGLLIPE